MKNCLLFLIVTIVSTVYCGDNPADIPPQPPRPHPNSTTTTAKPTTLTPITTTLAPETTTPKTPPSPSPNSTTTAPTTTTPKPTPSPSPNSTTTAPTTTTLKPTSPPSPNSTTTAPTTTTLKPTTSKPTPSPTPIPNPIMGNWSVTDPKTKQSCILMDAALQIEIPNTKINKTTKINVPVKASSSGNCSTINQVIYLEWNSTILVNDSLKFEFSKLLNKSQFELLGIDFTMSAGQNVTSLHHRRAEFVTPLANSYKCNKLQTFNLTDDKNVTIAYLHVSHLQLQAYRNSTGQSFDSAKDCESSVTPDVVPIVVGCVLAVLVVAVLVAYLVGRRRCQARGYLSMFTDTEKESRDEEELIPMKTLSCFK